MEFFAKFIDTSNTDIVTKALFDDPIITKLTFEISTGDWQAGYIPKVVWGEWKRVCYNITYSPLETLYLLSYTFTVSESAYTVLVKINLVYIYIFLPGISRSVVRHYPHALLI